jgi:hypothetical protein
MKATILNSLAYRRLLTDEQERTREVKGTGRSGKAVLKWRGHEA